MVNLFDVAKRGRRKKSCGKSPHHSVHRPPRGAVATAKARARATTVAAARATTRAAARVATTGALARATAGTTYIYIYIYIFKNTLVSVYMSLQRRRRLGKLWCPSRAHRPSPAARCRWKRYIGARPIYIHIYIYIYKNKYATNAITVAIADAAVALDPAVVRGGGPPPPPFCTNPTLATSEPASLSATPPQSMARCRVQSSSDRGVGQWP